MRLEQYQYMMRLNYNAELHVCKSDKQLYVDMYSLCCLVCVVAVAVIRLLRRRGWSPFADAWVRLSRLIVCCCVGLKCVVLCQLECMLLLVCVALIVVR